MKRDDGLSVDLCFGDSRDAGGAGGFIRLQVHQNRAMKAAVQAILRDKLLQRFEMCRLQGYATSDERQNFESMYAQYHSLGGNGVMDDVRQKFFGLPME